MHAIAFDTPTSQEKCHPFVSRILLVEDCPDMQLVLSHMLERAGYEVTIAINGEEAVEIALAAWNEQPFGAILMDIQLPILDGHAATRCLRASGYSQPIVAISARSTLADQKESLSAGCNGYVSKLESCEQILAAVSQYVSSTSRRKYPKAALKVDLLDILLNFPECTGSILALLELLPSRISEIEEAFLRGEWTLVKTLSSDLGMVMVFGYNPLADLLRRLQLAVEERSESRTHTILRELHKTTEAMQASKEVIKQMAPSHPFQ
ncbi:response regulator [Oligoflexia bacterium]|nr:response regulator [Oligoflexia bacterium]